MVDNAKAPSYIEAEVFLVDETPTADSVEEFLGELSLPGDLKPGRQIKLYLSTGITVVAEITAFDVE